MCLLKDNGRSDVEGRSRALLDNVTVPDELMGETRDIMLVGHIPNIERLLRLLIEGSAQGTTAFPAHGIVALETIETRWVERWRIEG